MNGTLKSLSQALTFAIVPFTSDKIEKTFITNECDNTAIVGRYDRLDRGVSPPLVPITLIL